MPDATGPTEAARAQMLADVEKLILKMVRSSGLPAREHEDAAQDVRMEVWKATRGFDPDRGVKWVTYAGATAKRALQSMFSKYKSTSATEAEFDPDAADKMADPRAVDLGETDDTADALHGAVQRQLTSGLLDALAPALPRKTAAALPARELVERVAFGGVTCDDLATQFGQPLKAVRANLKNAIRKLKGRGLTQHVADDAEVEAILCPDDAKKHTPNPRSQPAAPDSQSFVCPHIPAEADPCPTLTC